MQSSDTVILNYLDLPPRILLWPVSEVTLVALPSFFMMFFGKVLTGFFISCVLIFVIKTFKRSFGTGYLHGVMYWYLPTSKEQFKVTPPSYVRVFIN